jgi:hypothetical protein
MAAAKENPMAAPTPIKPGLPIAPKSNADSRAKDNAQAGRLGRKLVVRGSRHPFVAPHNLFDGRFKTLIPSYQIEMRAATKKRRKAFWGAEWRSWGDEWNKMKPRF